MCQARQSDTVLSSTTSPMRGTEFTARPFLRTFQISHAEHQTPHHEAALYRRWPVSSGWAGRFSSLLAPGYIPARIAHLVHLPNDRIPITLMKSINDFLLLPAFLAEGGFSLDSLIALLRDYCKILTVLGFLFMLRELRATITEHRKNKGGQRLPAGITRKPNGEQNAGDYQCDSRVDHFSSPNTKMRDA